MVGHLRHLLVEDVLCVRHVLWAVVREGGCPGAARLAPLASSHPRESSSFLRNEEENQLPSTETRMLSCPIRHRSALFQVSWWSVENAINKTRRDPRLLRARYHAGDQQGPCPRSCMRYTIYQERREAVLHINTERCRFQTKDPPRIRLLAHLPIRLPPWVVEGRPGRHG